MINTLTIKNSHNYSGCVKDILNAPMFVNPLTVFRFCRVTSPRL